MIACGIRNAGCNDMLQYVIQEEGRIRWAQKRNSTTGAIYYAFEYDYFLRDHLGNVRTVLTEGRDTSTYAATMESADSVVVRALFSNVYDPINTVLAKPTGFDSDGANQKVSRLNASAGTNKKIGPSLVLKVMAGDKVQISTYAFYNTAVQPPPGGVDLTSEILSLLSTGVVNNSSGKITSTSAVSTAVNPGVTNFLTNNRPYDNTRPKAYLNWVLFDNQFNYIASNSGVQQAVAGASKQALIAPLQTIGKNGYLYIYVSNESQQDVYFDDLNVKHYTGPLTQEQSYYPFGLQMAGISDKALNKLSSQYKFNGGVELEEDFGVNLYSTFFRHYDPQLGRFSGIDGLAEYATGINPYHFSAGDPINFNDPTGAVLEGPYYKPIEGVTVVGTRRKKHVSTFLNDALAWGNSQTGFDFNPFGSNFGLDEGGGGGSVYRYSVSQIPDRNGIPDLTDLDQVTHRGLESDYTIASYQLYGEKAARGDFVNGFSIGTSFGWFEDDSKRLLNHFLSGNGLPLHFGLNSYISDKIASSTEFYVASMVFEKAVLAHLKNNADLSTFDGDRELRRNRPKGFTSLYLMTVMGGWKKFSAEVNILSPSKISIKYNFEDHFGAGVDDSYSLYPGVSGMYYLQHYRSNANKYQAFKWDVDIVRTINR